MATDDADYDDTDSNAAMVRLPMQGTVQVTMMSSMMIAEVMTAKDYGVRSADAECGVHNQDQKG